MIYAKEVECYVMFQRLQSHSNLVVQIFPYFLRNVQQIWKSRRQHARHQFGEGWKLGKWLCSIWICDIVRGA